MSYQPIRHREEYKKGYEDFTDSIKHLNKVARSGDNGSLSDEIAALEEASFCAFKLVKMLRAEIGKPLGM